MTKPGLHAARRLWVVAGLFSMSIVPTHAAYGQTPQPCKRAVLTQTETADLLRIDAAEVARLAEQGRLPARRVGSAWRFSCAALMAWLTGEEKPAAALDGPLPLTAEQIGTVTGAGAEVAQAGTPPSASAPPSVDGQNQPVGEAPQERPADEIFLRGQRVLLGRGDVVLDFGQFYARADDHLLASIDGGVGLATVRQQTFTTLLQGRIGIFNETELFAGATFNRQENRRFFGSTDLADDRRSEFGGTTLGIRRTVLREGVRRPNIIATLSGHIPTGDRPYVAGVGLVLVKSVDPVALFAGANYFRAIRRGSSTAPSLGPEQSVDVSVGYALALNDTLAISMAVSGLFTGAATTLDDRRLRQPGTFAARFGVTSWLARGLYIEPSVSFALTGPGSSFAFGVTLPYSF